MTDKHTIEILAANRGRFLGFLHARLGTEEAAEEALQAAMVKSLERAPQLRDESRIVAWFYRMLRNDLTDRHRGLVAESRALEQHRQESAPFVEWEAPARPCACLGEELATLKPEYQAAITRLELDGVTLDHFAREFQITANNAGVRVHRARGALHKRLLKRCGSCAEGKCRDCSCSHGPSTPAGEDSAQA